MENDDEKRALFLEWLSETANVSEACRASGIPRSTAYLWRSQDEQFAHAWDEANELGTDGLEDEAVRRGRDGVEEPVFYRGSECGAVRKYSDTLLIFMLKARRPDKFKDRIANEVSGPGGGPLLTEVEVVHHKLAPPLDNADGGIGAGEVGSEGPAELSSGSESSVGE